MGVRSLGGVVFHTVSHNQFDTYVICSGAVHEWSKGVSAIVGQMFHFELSHACIKIAVHVGSVGVMIAFKKSLVHLQYCIKSPFSLGINASMEDAEGDAEEATVDT